MSVYRPIRVSQKVTTRAIYTEVADGFLIIVSKQATSGGAINFLRQISNAAHKVDKLKSVCLLLPDASVHIRDQIEKDLINILTSLGSDLSLNVVKKDRLTDMYLSVVTRVYNGV